MIKFVIRENIEYEGYRQWTLIAHDQQNAFDIIKVDRRYTNEPLIIQSTKPIKGTNKAVVLAYTENFEQ